MSDKPDAPKSDEISEAFRVALARGEKPILDEWLKRSPISDRDTLLTKLVPIEVFFRLQEGEPVSVSDYEQWSDVGISAARKALVENFQYDDQLTETLERRTESKEERSYSNNLKLPSRIGPYTLAEIIGKGGMGFVWRAIQSSPVERDVALKLIRADRGSPEAIARFNVERQALAMLDHPNIASIYDAGTTQDGSPYFVMELVHGVPITEFCDNQKLGIRPRLELFIQLCRAVQHAHQKGIIHRDLKPSNVIVGTYDNEPVVKVIDFGLAKALQSSSLWSDKIEHTKVGQVLGTLQYMSPEQAAGGESDVDTRSDVFSLGVILYELLTGTTPIHPDSMRLQPLLELVKLIRDQEPSKPSDQLSSDDHHATAISKRRNISVSRLRNILKGELDWVVMKALEKERPRRYATANELAEDISRFLNSEPVTARPASFGYRLRKIAKRHSWIFGTSALLLLVLLASLFLISRYALESASLAKSEAIQKGEAKKKAAIAREEAAKAKLAQEFAEVQLSRNRFSMANDRIARGKVEPALKTLGMIDPNRRRIEWGFANFEFQKSTLLLFGHSNPIVSSVFGRDGSWIATAAQDRVILWDATAGLPIKNLTAPDMDQIQSMDINQNGKNIAAVGGNRLVVWDSQSGAVLLNIDELSPNAHKIRFHPTEDHVAISNLSTSDVEVRDTRTGRRIINISTNQLVVESFCFHPSRDWIVTAGRIGPIKIWNRSSGKLLKELNRGNASSNRARCVEFSPSGRLVGAGCDDGRIRIWDVNSGMLIQTLSGHKDRVSAIDFSPNEASIASASYDQTVRAWDLANGEQTSLLHGHSHWVHAIDHSPDGSRLVSGGFDQVGRVWDLADQSHAIVSSHLTDSTPASKRNQNVHLSSSHDGKLLASAADDAMIQIWDIESITRLKTLRGHVGPIGDIRFFPGGKRLVAGTRQQPNKDYGPVHNNAKVWDVESAKVVFELKGHQSAVPAVAISQDGTRIATGSRDKTVKVWDSNSGELLKTITGNSAGGVTAVAICSENQCVAAASGTAIRLFDIDSGNLIRKFSGHVANIHAIAFDSSGSRLISAGGGFDNSVKVWNVKSGELQLTVKAHQGAVRSVQFAESVDRFISAGDRTVKIWDLHSGEPLLSLECQRNVTGFVFTKNESRIIAASSDASLKIWERWNELRYVVLDGHSNRINKLEFSTNSQELFSETKLKKLAWDLSAFDSRWNSILPKEQPELEFGESHRFVSSEDGKWQALVRREEILLVPHFPRGKESNARSAYYRIKARPKPRWHMTMGASAKKQSDWFAAAFHFGWASCFIPTDRSISQLASDAFNKLEESSPDSAAILRQTMTGIFDY